MSDYLSRVAVCDGAPDNIPAEKARSTIPTNPERITSWATSVSGFSPTNPFVPLPSEVPIPFEDVAQARTHSGGDEEASADDGMSRVASYEGFLPMKTLPNVHNGEPIRPPTWGGHPS
ncbi:hypothetical protein ONZ45_g10137 [Pleurotus djamor]|nr:hypothetical protein ONZ45_g10137 [Pleurotus djamor]